MKEFKLPKLWFIKGDHTNKEAGEAWNKLAGGGYSFLDDCIYYLDYRGKDKYTRGKPPEGYTQISLEEFLDYVIDKKQPISHTFTQDSEYNELLIKLLKDE